jgi:hypothetical protein
MTQRAVYNYGLIQLHDKSKTAANTGFASGGVTCKLEALCFYLSSVLVDSFVLLNPPERKARKRYHMNIKKPGNHRLFLISK